MRHSASFCSPAGCNTSSTNVPLYVYILSAVCAVILLECTVRIFSERWPKKESKRDKEAKRELAQ